MSPIVIFGLLIIGYMVAPKLKTNILKFFDAMGDRKHRRTFAFCLLPTGIIFTISCFGFIPSKAGAGDGYPVVASILGGIGVAGVITAIVLFISTDG